MAFALFALALCGCAVTFNQAPTAPSQPVVRKLVAASEQAQIPGSAPAAPVIHIGFADATGAIWLTDDWTNQYSMVALTSSDPRLPISQWASNTPALEIYNGALCFELPVAEPFRFVRALYIDKGASQ